jgi:hypothetical protein
LGSLRLDFSGGEGGCVQELGDHFRRVARAMLRGQVVPLLGAGANLCGRSPDVAWRPFEHLPSGRELAQHLAEHFDYPTDDPLELVRVSEYAFVLNGSGPLYDRLREVFDSDYPISPLHRFLARLPRAAAEAGESEQGLLVVTTNYDDALERALLEEEEPFDVVSYLADGEQRGRFVHLAADGESTVIERPNEYRGLDTNRTVVLKMHGAIDRANPDGRWDSYVITEDHYIEYLANTDVSNLVPVTLAAKLRRCHFLFLGYAMRDWNLRVILHRIWGAQKLRYKSWAVQLDPDVIDREFWELRGVDVIDAELGAYVARLEAELRSQLAPAPPV